MRLIKNDETNTLKTNGDLLKVKSIAACNTFDLDQAILGLDNHYFVFFFRDRLRKVLLYIHQFTYA